MKNTYCMKIFFLCMALFKGSLYASTYPRVHVENTTPYLVHISARYSGCKEDEWDGPAGILMPDGTVQLAGSTPSDMRGWCLLNELWAYVYVERQIFDIDGLSFYPQKIRVETEHYTSSGTSYAQFRIREVPIDGWDKMPVDTRGPLPFTYIMERR